MLATKKDGLLTHTLRVHYAMTPPFPDVRMPDNEKHPPPLALDYSPDALPKSSWPVGLYLFALIWAFVTMRIDTAFTTAYRSEAIAELRTQLPLLACAAARLAWARWRREQGRGWVFYVVLLFAAPVLWAVLSPPLGQLGRMLWGGPIIS